MTHKETGWLDIYKGRADAVKIELTEQIGKIINILPSEIRHGRSKSNCHRLSFLLVPRTT